LNGVPQPISWQLGTVSAIRPETRQVKTFAFSLPDRQPHKAGQHYDLRLTAADGYEAQRSYSVASAPEQTDSLELCIERLPDGEVSAFMHDVVVIGDRIELRGPIGGYFVWSPTAGGPLLLIGGGSGIVPLMAMLRHRAAAGSRQPATLLYSSRSREEAIYFDELGKLAGMDGDSGLRVIHTLTRSQPPGWKGYARRIDPQILREVLQQTDPGAQVFICGPTPLVESAANALVDLGVAASRIRTERFGPTGT
jgi:ferredoxin-NADP reductase